MVLVAADDNDWRRLVTVIRDGHLITIGQKKANYVPKLEPTNGRNETNYEL